VIDTLKTITVKDAVPAGNDTVVAVTEFKIVGDGQNSNKIISGRASITLAKTPDGWLYCVADPTTTFRRHGGHPQ
jgi:ketosteroid isomerase-like protein